MRSLARCAAAAIAVSAGAAEAVDVEAGRKIFLVQCFVCHVVQKGGPSKVGPNLHGMFGRQAGTGEGFAYSRAMVDSEVVWTEETAADYIRNPSRMMRGTKMAYVGLKQPEQLEDLIAYLKQATQ